jgi:hypothetical protein
MIMSKAKDEERAREFDRGAPENTRAAAGREDPIFDSAHARASWPFSPMESPGKPTMVAGDTH